MICSVLSVVLDLGVVALENLSLVINAGVSHRCDFHSISKNGFGVIAGG